MKYYLLTLGCAKNVADSDGLGSLLDRAGYAASDRAEDADVLIVNTCGFIGPAKEESIDAILAAHQLKQEGRCKAVIATGPPQR